MKAGGNEFSLLAECTAPGHALEAWLRALPPGHKWMSGPFFLMQQGKHLQQQDRASCSGQAGCALARHGGKCAHYQVGVIVLLIRTKPTLYVKKKLHLSKLKEKVKLRHHGYLT